MNSSALEMMLNKKVNHRFFEFFKAAAFEATELTDAQ